MHYIGHVIFWVTCGLLAAIVTTGNGPGNAKRAAVGFVLGPLGLGLAAFRVGPQECRFCHGRMNNAATVCPTCRREVIRGSS